MEVVSLSALPVASVAWQSSPGAHVLTVICKATFALEPGESPLAAEQEPIGDQDRVATRASAGVVLTGPGFPHGDRPGRAPVAHIVVGEIDARLEIQADARFHEELGPLSALRADERLLLENLHAEHPRLLTRLPGIRPFAFLDRLGAPQRFGFEADTLWIDTARALCALTFRVAIPLRSADEKGAVLVTLGQAGHDPTWADIPTRRPPMPSDDFAGGDEIEGPIDDIEGPLDDAMGDHESELHASLPTQRPPALTIPFDLARGDLQALGLPFSARSPLPPPPPPPPTPPPPTPPPPPSEARRATGVTALPFRATSASLVLPIPPASLSSTGLPPPIPPPRHSEPVRFAHPSTAPPPPMPPPSPPSIGRPPPLQMPSPPLQMPAPPQRPSPPLHAAPPLQMPASLQMPAPPLQMPSPPASVRHAAPPLQVPPPPSGASLFTAPAQQIPLPPGSSSVNTGGVFFASAAAASANEPWFGRRAEAAPASASASTPAPSAPAAARSSSPKLEPDGAIQLVFHDADSMPRIRRTPRWRSLLLDLEKRPPDPDLEDPAFAKDPVDVEDRREIFEILARGVPAIAIEVNEALVAAVRDDGKMIPPLLLVGGEIQLPFDEIETLRATVTTVTPLAGNDENLRASLDVARQFLAIPGLATAPAVAEGLTSRIREAWSQGKRVVVPGYLDAQTERVLTEQRHYQRRTVFGSVHLRALVHAGGTSPIPAYLPESSARLLPLFPRFKVRLVAEVHLQIDPYESHQAALRGLALARVSPLPKR